MPALVDDAEDEVLNDLFTNAAQLWPGERSAMVTYLTVSHTPPRDPEPSIVVWLGGGDLKELLSLRPGAEAWARSHGAKAARINGRAGWARTLRAQGYAPDGAELRKAL